jgi:predicted metal-dependent TIM-barrel fold hydrolase
LQVNKKLRSLEIPEFQLKITNKNVEKERVRKVKRANMETACSRDK